MCKPACIAAPAPRLVLKLKKERTITVKLLNLALLKAKREIQAGGCSLWQRTFFVPMKQAHMHDTVTHRNMLALSEVLVHAIFLGS